MACGGQGELCFDSELKGGELLVSVARNALKVLRNDLKFYETLGTGAVCSGEKPEKSTAIQVILGRWFAVFPCSDHPPRERSTISQLYDSGSANQGQSIQFWRQKCAG